MYMVMWCTSPRKSFPIAGNKDANQLADRKAIGWAELKVLSLPLLQDIAMNLLRDIDNGEEDKNEILNRVSNAIRKRQES